jgi:hypothetical protein
VITAAAVAAMIAAVVAVVVVAAAVVEIAGSRRVVNFLKTAGSRESATRLSCFRGRFADSGRYSS